MKKTFKPYFEKKILRLIIRTHFLLMISKKFKSNFKVINILIDDNEKSKFLYHVETKVK